MNGMDFLTILGELDDSLIPDATESTVNRRRRVLKRWIITAVCLVLVFGATAYATDLFGIRFPSEPKEGTMTIRDNEGKNGAYKTYSLEVCAPAVDKKLINGNVQAELDAIK